MTRATPIHSPAPWSPDEDGDIVDTNENLVVVVSHCPAEDRRLILKAPDLLAVCREMVIHAERSSLASGSATYARMKSLVDEIDGAS